MIESTTENDLINDWKWFNQQQKVIKSTTKNDLINGRKWFNQRQKVIESTTENDLINNKKWYNQRQKIIQNIYRKQTNRHSVICNILVNNQLNNILWITRRYTRSVHFTLFWPLSWQSLHLHAPTKTFQTTTESCWRMWRIRT